MLDPTYTKAKEISDIIANFRSGELCFEMNADHVLKWAQQFSADAIDVILEETYEILSRWYISDEQITDFLTAILSYLDKQGISLDQVTFWNGQDSCKSQGRILKDFYKLFPSCSLKVDTVYRKHIIYIDDGLYTGSKIRKEIGSIIKDAPSEVESISAFVLIAYSNGFSFAQKELEEFGREQGIKVQIERYKELCNDKGTEYFDGAETYVSSLGVLWPSHSLRNEPAVEAFETYLSAKGKFSLKYKTHSVYTSQIFTSMKRQEIVEKEFLLKGLRFLPQESINKGIYPLGYDTTRSFGFGSFCATKYNISNTCPIVLWWNVDASWYPLLPRRV